MTVAAASPAASPPGRDTLSQTLIAGLAGGAVDLLYASGMSVVSGQPAIRPWQAVASGWIGAPAARDGGMAAVLLGVVTHFGIALAMGAVFVLAARRLPGLTARPMIAGALYGLVLYGVMNLVVLPLRWPGIFPSWQGGKSGLDILAHVAVGLAIAWTVSSRKARAN